MSQKKPRIFVKYQNCNKKNRTHEKHVCVFIHLVFANRLNIFTANLLSFPFLCFSFFYSLSVYLDFCGNFRRNRPASKRIPLFMTNISFTEKFVAKVYNDSYRYMYISSQFWLCINHFFLCAFGYVYSHMYVERRQSLSNYIACYSIQFSLFPVA